MSIQQRSIQKILMTADTVGGVWTYALDLCRAFQNYGIQICLSTMGASLSVSQKQEADQLSNVEVRESHYKLEWMDNPWDDLDQAGEWLLNIEKEFEPDIVHLNGYVHAALNWHAPVVVAAHSCVLSWWQAVLGQSAPAEWDRYKQAVAQGLQAADAVVAISHTYAAELNGLYENTSNVFVIYNGRDAASFYSALKKKQAFAMGRIWDEAKNLAVLGQISNHSQLPVLVAGNNRHPDTGELLEIPNVHLLGVLNQAEVREQLAVSQIYILPAKYEPFGLSVLEAALSGCLLVLSDIPTFRELWQDAAFYFNPDKPEDLDTLLDYVLKHQDEVEEKIKLSVIRAQQYSLTVMATNYLNLYQSLIQEQLQPQSTEKYYL